MASVAELVPVVGVSAACEAIGVARASFYRQARTRVPRGNPVVGVAEPGGERSTSALPAPSLRHEGAVGERGEQIVPHQATDQSLGEPPPATNRTGTVLAHSHPRALSAAEQQAVRDVLHSDRFQDAAPAAVYATLLDAGTY
jgi:putative transposase